MGCNRLKNGGDMPKKLKTYPMSMDPEVYKLVRAIADAQSITMKEVFRVALGLYVAHNVHAFDIIKKGDRPPQPIPNTIKTTSQEQEKNHD